VRCRVALLLLSSEKLIPFDHHSGSPTTPSVPFASRANKLAVQESLNGDLDLPTSSQRVGDKPRVLLSSTTDPSTYNYRIAYEKPMERSEGELETVIHRGSSLILLPLLALDKQIDEAAEAFRDYYGLDDFGDPGAQSQVKDYHASAARSALTFPFAGGYHGYRTSLSRERQRQDD
jgi:hypothetical protein